MSPTSNTIKSNVKFAMRSALIKGASANQCGRFVAIIESRPVFVFEIRQAGCYVEGLTANGPLEDAVVSGVFCSRRGKNGPCRRKLPARDRYGLRANRMKYVAGGLAIAFVTVLMILLVRHESAGLRETIKQAQSDSVDEALDRAPETATKAAGRYIGRVLNTPTSANKSGQSSDKNAGTAETAAPSQTASSSTASAPAGPTIPMPSGGPSLPLPKEPLTVNPIAAVGGLFDAGRQVIKSVDDAGQQTFAIDDKQAEEIGAEVHKMVLRNHKVLANPKEEARVRNLADPVIAECKRKTVKYTFTLLEDPTVNAFSHVGGYVYVHRGLLELLPDDKELQFVLAHEIGHVDLKHCDRGLNYTAPLGKFSHALVGELAQMAYHIIALGYQKDLEFEADDYAFHDLIQLGRTREEALSCARHMAKYARDKKIETALPKPASAPGAVVVEVENHFRSHPPADERAKRLEAIKL
jgi:hypothetical protein